MRMKNLKKKSNQKKILIHLTKFSKKKNTKQKILVLKKILNKVINFIKLQMILLNLKFLVVILNMILNKKTYSLDINCRFFILFSWISCLELFFNLCSVDREHFCIKFIFVFESVFSQNDYPICKHCFPRGIRPDALGDYCFPRGIRPDAVGDHCFPRGFRDIHTTSYVQS